MHLDDFFLDGLRNTFNWVKQAFVELSTTENMENSKDVDYIMNKLLPLAYWKILVWQNYKTFPEVSSFVVLCEHF